MLKHFTSLEHNLITGAMVTAQLVLGDGSKDEIFTETIEKYQEENEGEEGETNEQFLLSWCGTAILNIIPRRDIGQIQIL